MARASAEGHRVVVVFATNGEHGEVPDDLAQGETLIDRRRAEAMHSAEALGTARVEWLGYSDSGMTGWEQNAHTHAFHQANLTEAGMTGMAATDTLTTSRSTTSCMRRRNSPRGPLGFWSRR